MRIEPAFLFDLDGTLVDSVYQHVLAWKEALDSEGIDLSVWRIHRKIGMSGGLFTNQLERETGVEMSEDRLERLRRKHAEAYRRMSSQHPAACRARANCWPGSPMPASNGRSPPAGAWRRRRSTSTALGVDPAKTPVVTRDQVKYAKPDPDLFLAAAARLNAPIETAVRRRRQHLGHAGGGALPGARRRAPVRRLWRERTPAGDGLPRLRGPGRSARPHR